MIPDKVFKSLLHSYLDCAIFSKGREVEKGYKPDFVLNKDNDFIILESENSSSRKTFVGGLIKASHFITGDRQGILIFVIVPKENTKAESIAIHLKKYFEFITPISNIRNVYVIEADKYFNDDNVIKILEKDFIAKCFSVK